MTEKAKKLLNEVSPARFARMTGHDQKTIRRWCREGKIRCRKVGDSPRRYYIPTSELKNYDVTAESRGI